MIFDGDYIYVDRWILNCYACGLVWSIDTHLPPAAVHLGECSNPPFSVGVMRIRHRHSADPAEHCRKSEPRQNPPPDRRDRDGRCSWNCRGSSSAECFCPCGGEHHANTSRVNGPEARSVEDVMAQIQRARPRGDWPGRKST